MKKNRFPEDSLELKESLIPKKGYNVVIIDDFEPIGEELYLESHHRTLERAEKAVEKLKKYGIKAYIYSPDTF
jgi:hypothetical protein